jgi:hypothetical protein
LQPPPFLLATATRFAGEKARMCDPNEWREVLYHLELAAFLARIITGLPMRRAMTPICDAVTACASEGMREPKFLLYLIAIQPLSTASLHRPLHLVYASQAYAR